MNFINNIVALIVVLLSTTNGFSQIKARVDGLKDSQAYMQLMEQEHDLVVKQDSIVKIIDDKKMVLKSAADDNKMKLTTEILTLEGKLFEIRSQLGSVGSKSALMEQEYIIANIESGNISSSSAGANIDETKLRNLLLSSKIKGEISAEELKIVGKTKQLDALITSSISDIALKAVDAKSIYEAYVAVGEKIEGDSLSAAHNAILNEISIIDENAVSQWEEIYSAKLDLYNRLLDKFGAEHQIVDRLNESSREMRSGESDIDAKYIAPYISKYVRQRKLVLEYEKELSILLKLSGAVDSITTEFKKIDVTKYDILKSVLPVQIMISYTPVSRVTANAHTALNPPLELTVPTKGDLYKIELGTYTKPLTTFTALNRVSPVEYMELPDGKYRYWAGSYKIEQEADMASKNLNKLGLKTKVAAWKDGINTLDSALSVGEYTVKITRFTTELKDLLTKEAPGKDIIKSTNQAGATIYNIGIFQTRIEAQRVADLIGEDAKLVLVR